jgi:hypothetical protein
MTNNIINQIITAHVYVKANIVCEENTYCFDSTRDGSGEILKDDHGRMVYVPINRRYKPIGETTKQFVRYEDYVDTHGLVFELDPFKMGDVWDRQANELRLYVYDDSVPASRRDYAKHMRAIMVHAKPYDGKLH